MLVRVESGKGRKDRDTILSKRLLPELRYYYKACRPRNWLFPAKDTEKHICATTAQRAYTKAKKKAKIKKGKGIHTFRHYAEYEIMPSCQPRRAFVLEKTIELSA